VKIEQVISTNTSIAIYFIYVIIVIYLLFLYPTCMIAPLRIQKTYKQHLIYSYLQNLMADINQCT